jgi:hypothetical protein
MLLVAATAALPHGSVKSEDPSAVCWVFFGWDSMLPAPFCEVFLQLDELN